MLTPEEEEKFLKCIRDYDRKRWDEETEDARKTFLKDPNYPVLVEGFLRANESEQLRRIYLEQLVQRWIDQYRADAANKAHLVSVGVTISLAAVGPGLFFLDKQGFLTESGHLLALGATAFCIAIALGYVLQHRIKKKFEDALRLIGLLAKKMKVV